MAGLLDQIFGGPPSYQQAAMDPGAKSQVAGFENQNLGTTPQQYSDFITKGTGAAAGVQNQDEAIGRESAEEGGSQVPGMNQAIANRAQKNFSQKNAQLAQNAKFSGAQMANQNINMATANAIALYGAQNNVNSSLNQLQLQANQARYNTISSIMSGAGSFAGTMTGMMKPAQVDGPTAEDTAALNAEAADYAVPTVGSSAEGFTPFMSEGE